MTLFLLRYGEIGLKSQRVRRRFERILIERIERAFADRDLDCVIERSRGRLFLYTDTDAAERARWLLERTFGLVSFSPAEETGSKMETIIDRAVSRASDQLEPATSFAIRARRHGTHPYTSMELAGAVGYAVLEANGEMGLTVDLDEPDWELSIEVRDQRAFIFTDKFAAPGGLPIGSQGKVVVVVEREIALLAAWLMMKRGCRVYPICFPDRTDADADTDTDSNAAIGAFGNDKSPFGVQRLSDWSPGLQVKWRGFARPGEEGAEGEGGRRGICGAMLDIAHRVARREHAAAVVTGETLGAFDAMRSRTSFPIPIFYPLVGFSEEERAAMFRESFSS